MFVGTHNMYDMYNIHNMHNLKSFKKHGSVSAAGHARGYAIGMRPKDMAFASISSPCRTIFLSPLAAIRLAGSATLLPEP